MKKETIIAAILLSLFACSDADLVGKDSVRAFEEILQFLPAGDVGSEWSVVAPDGGASFLWNGESMNMLVNIEPFVEAGLNAAQLGNITDGVLVTNADFESLKLEKTKAIDDFRAMVGKERKKLGYHFDLDHYNLLCGDGNLFEWAKNMDKNGTTKENQDKDIVFVLNPEPLIAAGVNAERVNGWVYAQVKVDINGKKTDVWKFLKAFDLK
jgi:hypothetical protein